MWSQVGLRKHYCEQACGGNRISAELFKILKDDVVKMLHSVRQQIWKTQQKRSVFILIPKKGIAKDSSSYHTTTLISHAINSKIMSRKQQHNPLFLPGESHRQRSLTGYSSWRHKESDVTEWLSICLKSFKLGFSSMWMYLLGLEEAEEPEIKLPTFIGSWRKEESFRKISISALLTIVKTLTLWITRNCGRQFTIKMFFSLVKFSQLI